MPLRYPKMRLVMPSLQQHNENAPDWCGRTSASMIFNYYYAAKKGGIDACRNELIINQRTGSPRELVFRGPANVGFPTVGGAQIAAYGFDLRGTLEKGKALGWSAKHQIYPQEQRTGTVPSEEEVLQRFAPVTRALELNNPVLFYSGLSKGVRHIVVISGYWLRGSALWLHIDDPSTLGSLDPAAKLHLPYYEPQFHTLPTENGDDPRRQIEMLRSDAHVDGAPGIRYWLHARVLFRDKAHTAVEGDVYGDHGSFGDGEDNSPGMTVIYNTEPTESSVLVQAEVAAGYPVALERTGEADGTALLHLWKAATATGAPYPLGTNRSWHDGVHIPLAGSGVASDEVLSSGGGEVVAARFPETIAGGVDRGVVVIRHAFDSGSLRLYRPESDDLPKGHHFVFSLFGNLKGGKAGAKKLLERVAPGPERPLVEFFSRGAPLTILAPVQNGKSASVVPLEGAGPRLGDRTAVPKAREYGLLEEDFLTSKELDGWLVAKPSYSNLEAWEERPKGANALIGERAALLRRLENGESALLGVYLEGGGWMLDGDVVRVRDDYQEPTIQLYRGITGKGTNRSFLDERRDFEPVETIATVKGLALPCVVAFTGRKKQRALVEVSYAVRQSEIEDNSAEVEQREFYLALHEELSTALVSEELVDLRKLDIACGITPEKALANGRLAWRNVSREAIGVMGRLSALDGREAPKEEAAENRGVHVELFSTGDLIGQAFAGLGWISIKDESTALPGTEAFFRAQLKQLFMSDDLGCPAKAAPTGTSPGLGYHDSDEWRPPEAAQWVAFSSRHPRTLSRFVVEHRSEWAVDWNAVSAQALPADAIAERISQIPEADRKPLLPGNLQVPGLEGDNFLYYHPLRLVEWLTTGIDLSLGHLEGREVVPWISFDDDNIETVALVDTGGEDDDTFRARLILGDPTSLGQSDPAENSARRDDVIGQREGVLVLDGLDTPNDQIPILLRRGQVHQMSFVQPHASFELLQRGLSPRTKAFPVNNQLAALRPAPNPAKPRRQMFLLADANAKLPTEGPGQAIVIARASYNWQAPKTATIAFAGTGFRIASITMSGDSEEALECSVDQTLELDLAIDTPEHPRSAREVVIAITVVPEQAVGQKATLTIAFEGGDLPAREEATFTFETRSIALGAPKDEDIAKLQLYLSQLLDTSDLPAYRPEAKYGPPIDGEYTPELARALWRFVLSYGDSVYWSAELTSVETSGGPIALSDLSFVNTSFDAEVDRLMKQKLYPIVGAPLIAEILRAFAFPNVLPTFEIASVGHATLENEYPEIFDDWGSWSEFEKTSIPPVEDYPGTILVQYRLASDPGGDRSAVPVDVELRDAVGYRLNNRLSTLADLLAQPVELCASGSMIPKSKVKPTLVVGAGSSSHTLTLGGTPDYLNARSHGYAAALLQAWMRRFEIKGAPVFDGNVDGDWNDASKKAFAAVVADAPKKIRSDYVALVAYLLENSVADGNVVVRASDKDLPPPPPEFLLEHAL